MSESRAERRAFADRKTYLGDPDFVRPPVARFLSPAHIAEERAAGGPRIITSTLDIVRQVVTYGVPIGTALAAPRVHHQWLPDVVYAESGALAPAVRAELTAHGYRFIDAKPFTLANAIAREHGALTAAHDPRGATGSARAY